jgi:hypothetical protein
MDNKVITASAKEFVEKFDIKRGWSQEQHVGFVFNLIVDMLGVETKEDKDELLSILALTCNPSAFRQKLESNGILEKSERGERSNVLANKYV